MQNIESILEQWSEKLGIGSEVIWESLIFQARISGITSVLTLILSFFLVIYCCRFAKEMFIKFDNEYSAKDEYLGLMIVSIGLAVMLVFITIPIVNEIFTTIINPEYWALSRIKSLLP